MWLPAELMSCALLVMSSRMGCHRSEVMTSPDRSFLRCVSPLVSFEGEGVPPFVYFDPSIRYHVVLPSYCAVACGLFGYLVWWEVSQ